MIQNNVIFIHIPRTGGSSMESAFGLRDAANRKLSPFYAHDQAKNVIKPEHAHYFKFSFVRHPLDRLVSMWFKSGQNKPFSTWLDDRNQFVAMHWCRTGENPFSQWDYLSDGKKLLVDFVGRFESLEKDWHHVCGKIGKNLTLPHLSATQHKPWKCYFDPETFEKAAALVREDMEIFGYD